MPFLFLFHLATRFKSIESYHKEFNKLMGTDGSDPDSILGLFKRHGLDTNRLTARQITYDMAEKVVIDFKNK